MDIHCQVGKEPKDDREYFEQMTKAVFRSGFSWQVIESKWPGFQKAFAHFSIVDVADFDEPDIDRLLQDKGIVRNNRKIRATINNAREILMILNEYDSFHKYLDEVSQEGEEKLCKTLSKRFAHLGQTTSMFFLRAVGLEMSQMISEWKKGRENRLSRMPLIKSMRG